MGPVEFFASHRVLFVAVLGTWLLLWFWSAQRLTNSQRWVDDRLRLIEGLGLFVLVVWFLLTMLGALR